MKVIWKELALNGIIVKGGDKNMDYVEQGSDMPLEKVCETNTSPLNRLKRDKGFLEAKLADINAAIDALETNPEICKVLELVAKARR